jgi:hypothetical protein
MPTLTQINGFEHGLATSGVPGVFDTIVGTPAIVTTTPRTGVRCLECSSSAATESAAHNIGGTVAVFGFALYIPNALPTADMFLAMLVTGGTIDCALKFRNSDDRLILSNHTSGEVVAGPVIAADTWYWIDGRLTVSANPFTCDWAVDGVAQTQWTGAAAATTITSIHLGWRSNAQTLTVRYDDLIFGVTSGDYPFGPHSVERLLPTSDGTHNTVGANQIEQSATGTDITDATTDAFSLIDDAPLDVAVTDYINDVGTSATAYVEILFEDLPAGSDVPVDVKGYQVDRDSTATGTSAAHSGLLLADDTAVTPDLRLSSDDPGTTITTRKKMLARPTGDWDRTKVNGLKARLGFGDGAPDVFFASLMLEVAMQTGDAAIDLEIDNLSQAQALEAFAITQDHQLVIANLSQAETLEAFAFTQAHELVIAALTQAQTLDNLVVNSADNLAIASLTQAQTIDGLTLTQIHQLVIDSLMQAQTLNNLTLTQIHQLVIAALTQEQALDNVALTQLHQLVIADLTQEQTLTNLVVIPGGPAPTLRPTIDVVAVALIRVLSAIPASRVDTTLPKDTAVWSDGFVQVIGVSEQSGMYVPLHASVINVSCWATNIGSGKPPWGKANQLSEIIKVACLEHSNFPVTLDLSTLGDYGPARVHSAYFITEPHRIPSDEGSYARYDGDLQIHWTPL